MIITRTDLTTTIQNYNGANVGGSLILQGFVDVSHNGNLIAHHNLTQLSVEDVRNQGLTAVEIEALGTNEADLFLACEECNKKIDDYIFAYNLGLYGNGGGV